MRYFQPLARGANFTPLLHDIISKPELWDQFRDRQTFEGSPHREVSDIWLRFQDTSGLETPDQANDQHEVVPYPAWHLLPRVQPIVFDLMRLVQGTRLGRCLITRLRPEGRIYPHKDSPAHTSYYRRYQCTQQAGNSTFRIEDETIHMAAGDIWWIDNSQEHEVYNGPGQDDRIALVVDIH